MDSEIRGNVLSGGQSQTNSSQSVIKRGYTSNDLISGLDSQKINPARSSASKTLALANL
jgi:hypothetical protein